MATRCIICGLFLTSGEETQEEFERSMRELEALTKAAGFEMAASFTQALPKRNAGTYIGSGKIDEIKIFLNMEPDTKLVIFDNQLSPIQLRNLSNALDVPVIDRTNLILRIFSDRARTREARLQVDYARLQYALPRLVGMHSELSRQGGTSGAMSNRGAGETKIELDRRKIEHQIHEIKKGLDVIEKERATQRSRRMQAGIPRVSLVGYTNAGKSTIMNSLLTLYGDEPSKTVFEKDMLFATLDTTVRKINPGRGQLDFLLSDTVGFISNLPTTLVKAFRSTLDETKYANLLLLVCDLSDPDFREDLRITVRTLEEIGAGHIKKLFVFNKADLSDNADAATISSRNITDKDQQIIISARDQKDIERLVHKIEEMLKQARHSVTLLIPYSKGSILGALQKSSSAEILDYKETGTLCHALLEEGDYQRYKAYIV